MKIAVNNFDNCLIEQEREMRIKSMILLISLILGTYSAEAAKRVRVKSSKKGLNKTSVSKTKKASKLFSIGAELGGIKHNAVAQSVEASYKYRSDLSFSLSFTHMISGIATFDEGKYSSDELRVWRRNGKGSALSLSARKFFGKSFYIRPSGYYRNQDHVNKTESKVSPSGSNEWIVIRKETGRIEDIGVGLAIGNQWNWKYLSIGCDWVGVNRSLNIISQRGELESEDINTINLLNLYVSTSF